MDQSLYTCMCYMHFHPIYIYIYIRCWRKEMMLKENNAAAVAYKDLKDAKDNITKAFKALETIAKAHKSEANQMATDEYKAAVTKVQCLVMIIQACLPQQIKQSANAHAFFSFHRRFRHG